MNLYEDQFLEIHDFPRIEKPSKVLVVASTARCGSHMLGHALQKTGKFGFPLEYVNPANLAEWKRRLELEDLAQVLEELQKRRTSPNGVFGIKIHYSQIAQVGGFDRLVTLFPDAYFVLLSRSDVLGQAVSLSIAQQTGVWISGQKPVRDNPVYSYSRIEQCLRSSILGTSSWRFKLAGSGANYMELDFGLVQNELAKSIGRIAGFMNVELDECDIPIQQATARQSSEINQEWRDRFRSEFSLKDEFLPRSIRKLLGIHRRLKNKFTK